MRSCENLLVLLFQVLRIRWKKCTHVSLQSEFLVKSILANYILLENWNFDQCKYIEKSWMKHWLRGFGFSLFSYIFNQGHHDIVVRFCFLDKIHSAIYLLSVKTVRKHFNQFYVTWNSPFSCALLFDVHIYYKDNMKIEHTLHHIHIQIP